MEDFSLLTRLFDDVVVFALWLRAGSINSFGRGLTLDFLNFKYPSINISI